MAQELIRESCDVWDDPQGIPHVRGRTDRVALSCLGLLHGRERGWQMDFLRLTAQGRKAEVLGKEAIRADFLMRVLGLAERAKVLFAGLDPESQNDLWAYSFGVNRGFIVGRPRSYEARELKTEAEPWMPWDTILLLLLQSFDQTRKTFETDFRENARLAIFPGADPAMFSEDGLPWDTAVLQEGEYPKRTAKKSPDSKSAGLPSGAASMGVASGSVTDSALSLLWGEGRRESEVQGSNSWVLSRSRSRTSNAWLANDPHLNLKHPSFWMWAHVEGDHLNAIGASLPGVPLIASGSNLQVSWGLTNSYLDSADIFSVPEDEVDRSSSSFRPWVWFKFWGVQLPFFFKSFQRTAEGWPVLPIEAPKGRKYVLRWTGFDLQSTDIRGLFDVMKAGSVQEADQALSRVGLPSWNFVFADSQGSIGYRAIGKVLRRNEAPSAKIPEKSLAQVTRWPLLSSEEMPRVLDPQRGWLATANNRQWPSDSLFHGGCSYADGFRAFRIHELLVAGKQDRESIQRIQCDTQAVDAHFFLPRLIPLIENQVHAQRAGFSPLDLKALEALKTWDLQATLSCRACAPFRGMMEKLLASFDGNEGALYRALEGRLFPGTPSLAIRVPEAFREAVADLRLPPGAELPEWGTLHHAAFSHVSGLSQFETPPIPTPGDENTVNPGNAHSENGQWSQYSGASQRLIVEMTSPPTVYAILAGSNADLERPNLNRESSPWRKWAGCLIEKRFFPVDWRSVSSAKLELMPVGNSVVPSR